MDTGDVHLVSAGNGVDSNRKHAVTSSSLSDDGTRVAFQTSASDIVEGDTNEAVDAFVTDLTDGTVRRVSVTSDGEQLEPFVYAESGGSFRDGAQDVSISGNGRIVAFASHANGLVSEDDNNNVDVFVHDLETRTTERISVTSNGEDVYRAEDRECGTNGQCFGFIASGRPVLTYDGRYVAFNSGAPRLTNANSEMGHIFVHDRVTGLTVLANRTFRGEPDKGFNIYPGSISADGRWLSFATDGRLLGKRVGRGENGDVYLQRLPIPFEAL
jgi:Tol biopolymer transport system component